ncbi:hypothetical protein [Actinoplanes sp. NPDC049118]|uniref:effector-associated constant component EACC1 n=1 Tax=Actinoplanes sp. NPDC049118 TaxID=3155769 RepID=UPI0033EACD78
MTQSRWELRVDGGQARRLAARLSADDGLRGAVRLVNRPPAAGQMGGIVELIAVTLGPGAAAAVLVEGVFAWMRSATSEVTVRITRPDGSELEVQAARVRRLSAAELPELAEKITRATEARLDG